MSAEIVNNINIEECKMMINHLEVSFCLSRYSIPLMEGKPIVIETPLFKTEATSDSKQIRFTFNGELQDESFELLKLLSKKNNLNFPQPTLTLTKVNQKLVWIPNETLPLRYAMIFRDVYINSKDESVINDEWIQKLYKETSFDHQIINQLRESKMVYNKD
jgi:hypothetical protein